MSAEYRKARVQLARLVGFCESAKELREFDVPESWINGLISDAKKCEDAFKAYAATRPGGE